MAELEDQVLVALVFESRLLRFSNTLKSLPMTTSTTTAVLSHDGFGGTESWADGEESDK